MSLLAIVLLASTVQVYNDTNQAVEVYWSQLEPAQTAEQTAIVQPHDNFDTKSDTGKGEVYAIGFRHRKRNVARPVIAINIETAMLLRPSRSQTYIAIRPFYQSLDAGAAINITAAGHPSSLYCIPLEIRQWRGSTIGILANGVFMELGGNVRIPQQGRQCFCGRAVDSPNKALGIDRFEAIGACN